MFKLVISKMCLQALISNRHNLCLLFFKTVKIVRIIFCILRIEYSASSVILSLDIIRCIMSFFTFRYYERFDSLKFTEHCQAKFLLQDRSERNRLHSSAFLSLHSVKSSIS